MDQNEKHSQFYFQEINPTEEMGKVSKYTCTKMFIMALFIWKNGVQPKCSLLVLSNDAFIQ